MQVRRKQIYTAIQYNKAGDHPLEYLWADKVAILDEESGKPWPESGRLASIAKGEVPLEDIRYSILYRGTGKYWDISLGWWIFEVDGWVVGVCSPEGFTKLYEEVTN